MYSCCNAFEWSGKRYDNNCNASLMMARVVCRNISEKVWRLTHLAHVKLVLHNNYHTMHGTYSNEILKQKTGKTATLRIIIIIKQPT